MQRLVFLILQQCSRCKDNKKSWHISQTKCWLFIDFVVKILMCSECYSVVFLCQWNWDICISWLNLRNIKKQWIFLKFTLCNIFNTSNKQTVAQYMYIWMFIWKTQTHCRVDDVWHCWSLLGQSDGRAFAVLELMQRQNYIFLGENCKCFCLTLGWPVASAQPHCNTVIIWGDYGRRMGCGMH